MPDRRWIVHPLTAWRSLLAAQADKADDEARAAGLTVEVLPGGLRRYRDPSLDGLGAQRARAAGRTPVRIAGVGGWSR